MPVVEGLQLPEVHIEPGIPIEDEDILPARMLQRSADRASGAEGFPLHMAGDVGMRVTVTYMRFYHVVQVSE